MGKKITTIYVDEEYLKILRALGYNISRLVESILHEVLSGRREELIEAMKKDIDAKLKEIMSRPDFPCVCGSYRYDELEPFHGMRRIRCRKCKTEYVYVNGKWSVLEKPNRGA